MTMPILPGLDGERRMSKSYGNYVGVTDPPEEMFGKLMSVPDAAMGTYYELLLGEAADAGSAPVEAKRALARRLVARFHGEEAAREAEEHFDRLHKEHLPAGGDRGGDPLAGPGLEREGPPAGAGGRALRHVAQRGPPPAGAGRDPAGRRAARAGRSWTSTVGRLEGAVLQVGKRQFRRIVAGMSTAIRARRGGPRRCWTVIRRSMSAFRMPKSLLQSLVALKGLCWERSRRTDGESTRGAAQSGALEASPREAFLCPDVLEGEPRGLRSLKTKQHVRSEPGSAFGRT